MLLRLGLIALVLVTSLSLGIARGQLRAGSAILLCGGAAVIVDPDDPQGTPRFCPDMATGVLLAIDPPSVTVGRDVPQSRRAALPGTWSFVPLPQPVPQARGPPAAQMSPDSALQPIKRVYRT